MVLILGSTKLARAEEPVIWSKRATVLHVEPSDLSCPALLPTILAPDGQTSAKVICKSSSKHDSRYWIQVRTPSIPASNAALDEGAHEVLWAPDSKTLFVNGGTSSYAGFFVTVYRLDPKRGLVKIDISRRPQQDMVKSFPPCRAWNRDAKDCKRIAAHPQFNLSGIRWTTDSSALDIFAEVPCSSSYGGIMCAVKGYEVDAVDGRIVRSYAASAIPDTWKEAMAWEMRVPDAPRYGAANATFR